MNVRSVRHGDKSVCHTSMRCCIDDRSIEGMAFFSNPCQRHHPPVLFYSWTSRAVLLLSARSFLERGVSRVIIRVKTKVAHIR